MKTCKMDLVSAEWCRECMIMNKEDDSCGNNDAGSEPISVEGKQAQ